MSYNNGHLKSNTIEKIPNIINIVEIVRTIYTVFFIPIESIAFPKGNIKNVNPNTKVKILDTMIYSGYKATCMIITNILIAIINPKKYLYFFQ